MDWRGVRVLVTGGRGLLGSAVAARLERLGAEVVAVGRSDADLRDHGAALRLFAEARPAVVVHCAVEGGGIGWMVEHPVESGRDNALIDLHSFEAASLHGAALFIGVGSACAYPRAPRTIPFVEDELWDGPPEPTTGPYAEVKRLALSVGRAYHQQGRMRCVFGLLANLYGPGDALELEQAHVVAGLVMRCLAQPDELVVWGTGRPTREHLFVEDAAEGLLALADRDTPEPVNLGTGVETSVADLVDLVADACDYRGTVRFDPSRPDGQPRKVLDVSRAAAELGWRARTPLAEGLARTVAWYREALGR